MQFNTDLSSMPRDRTIMVWLENSDWPEAIKWEEYDDESKEETGRDGCWLHAEELISDLGGEVEESEIIGWADHGEKPQRPAAT